MNKLAIEVAMEPFLLCARHTVGKIIQEGIHAGSEVRQGLILLTQGSGRFSPDNSVRNGLL